jgi:DinB family protein
MSGLKWFLVTLCLLPSSGALGKTGAPKDLRTVNHALARNVRDAEDMLIAVAAAMPEEKYEFAPTTGDFRGVRTVAQMARHVAVVNFMNASALLGEKTPVEVGEHENGSDSIKTKAEILKFRKYSFAYLLKATDKLAERILLRQLRTRGAAS